MVISLYSKDWTGGGGSPYSKRRESGEESEGELRCRDVLGHYFWQASKSPKILAGTASSTRLRFPTFATVGQMEGHMSRLRVLPYLSLTPFDKRRKNLESAIRV